MPVHVLHGGNAHCKAVGADNPFAKPGLQPERLRREMASFDKKNAVSVGGGKRCEASGELRPSLFDPHFVGAARLKTQRHAEASGC